MRIFVLLLAFVLCGSPAFCAESSIPLGERLVYNMTWLGIPIGTGELWAKEKTTLDGKEVFHVVGLMQTNKVLSTIYPVRNEIHSWIDAQTLTSVKFEKYISEGKTKAHEVMEFDKPAHDVISAFYWVRRQALKPGQSAKTVLIADKTEWALEVIVMKRETLLIEPTSKKAGAPKKKGKSLINLLDDESKLPIRITYKAPFGRMMGVLDIPESTLSGTGAFSPPWKTRLGGSPRSSA